jgi:uncharacterized membrane protein YesL
MRGFFSYDGRFASIMDKVAGLFWLNLLTLLTSLPVITAGASITACYYVTLKMARNEEGYLTKSFFRSFKQNFRQGTLIWLIMLFFGAIFFLDYKMLNITGADGTKAIPFANVLFIVICAVVIFFAITGIYVYPVLARFDNTIVNTIKNAFLMSVLNLPKTLLLLIINLIFPGLFVFAVMTGKALWLIPVVLCFGISAGAYFCSKVFVGIFEKYIPREDGKGHPENADQ